MIAEDRIAKLGTIVGIWAHPDDDTFFAAGIYSLASSNGQRVVNIIATRGELGVQDESKWPKESLSLTREREAHEALEILGVDEHYWLNYIDGSCKDADEDVAINKLTTLLEEIQPNSVLTFSPDGLTGHSDHQTISNWATKAVGKMNKALIKPDLFYTALPDGWEEKFAEKLHELNAFYDKSLPKTVPVKELSICCTLNPGVVSKKVNALKAHHSQTEAMFKYCGHEFMQDAWSTECFCRKT